MKLSLQATIVAAAIFAGICLSVAVTGFASLGDMTDPAQIADAKGFAWFWTFLATVSVALGAAAWWLAGRGGDGDA
jgi:hypothetical protein